MAEIIKTFRETVPAMRFIGKKYPNFGGWWGDWFSNGWFDQLEKTMGGIDSILKIWENGGGYVVLERRCEGQPFEYWIGMFAPADTEVPEGFEKIDFPAGGLGTCFIYGKEEEVHDTSGCRGAVENMGMEIWLDERGGIWSFENCLCPRYTTPDDKGKIIMDYCYFVE
mgnify:FL=1